MTDVTFALEAKSDQLNAVDIMAAERVIRIRDVQVKKGEQPVWVFFDGDNKRPWKPSKGMLRILAGAWGQESKNWIGKHAQIYYEPSVIYAGKPIGGIRIRALTNIDPKGLNFSLAINRSKREPYPVPLLVVNEKPYPDAAFDKAFPAMTKKMQDGDMTLQEVIAQCQKTGTLSARQLERLEEKAPAIIDDSATNEDPEQKVENPDTEL